ncbi:MAG: FapA family protein [Sulfurimonas sp.]|nr:FapA family protein [Sulfurimonas sp.]
MGLFSSSANIEQAPVKIRPTVVKTQNVAKELTDMAKKNGVALNSLDFEILEVKTFTRVNKEKIESDWEEIGIGELHELDDAAAILNKNYQIKQTYEIEIFTKNENDIFKKFNAAVGANATKCKIYLSIREGSEIPWIPKFEEEFLKYINKSKIRAGILVGVFDEMVFEVISKASAVAKVDGVVKYDKNQTILIAEGYEPTPTINDAFIKHYEKKSIVGENEKIDYSKRGFIHSVLERETLLEYIKPQKGKAGRNCRGDFMEPTEPLVRYAPTFTVDDTIEIVENRENILYKAKVSGYISFETGRYQVKSELDVGEVTFKTTGSILTGLGTDVSLSVKENDYQKDAIGTGMEVEVSEIDIKGNVGPNSKVHANRATVEGQTHKTSKMYAKNLTINIHKGFASGDDVKVMRLEHGVIEGKKVEVEQAIGGTIKAKDIEISLCASYVKAMASRLIEIKKLQGSENIFTIDPLLYQEKNRDFSEKKSEIHELRVSIDEIKKEIERYKKLINDNAESFKEIKKRLMYFKQNGIKMPTTFVVKYKQHIKAQEYLDGIINECQEKNNKLLLLSAKSASLQDSIFDARIINRDKWVGHNELIFKLIDPLMDLSYKPKEGSMEKIFAVVKMDDGTFEIRAVKE